MMKRIICLVLSLCCAVAFAQNAPKEVSLVVSADGATKTEAVNNALRSAIEQTFGTFVSANAEILNDQLVKDEIATVSSGNIQKYTEVAAVTLPNGNTSVTLDVTVSLSKLVSYAQSKGSECEFAGATFGANMRLYEFYKKNEQIAIENLIKQLNALRPIFDYNIIVSDPILNDKSYVTKDYAPEGIKHEDYAIIRISVTCSNTNKTEQFKQLLFNTLRSLGRPKDEIDGLMRSGFQFKECVVDGSFLFFYNEIPDLLYGLLHNIKYDFEILDNNKSEYILNYPKGLNKTLLLDLSRIKDPDERMERRRARSRGERIPPVVDWMQDNTIFDKLPFAVPVNNLQRISKISINPTVANRTNFIYENKSGYMIDWLIYGKQLIIGHQGPTTCYRTRETPRCDVEYILNNPSEVLHIYKGEHCEKEISEQIGMYMDNNIRY